MATVYPIRFEAHVRIHQDCDEDKVRTFFKKCGFVLFDFQGGGLETINYVDIDNPIKLYFQQTDWHSSVWPSTNTFLCFYDNRRISKALPMIFKEIKNTLKPKQNFDDTLILLVGIKDECEQNKESYSDNGSQVHKPNVRFVEWCVNSSEQDTREILQDLIRVTVVKSYIDLVRHLQDKKWFNEDEDQQMFLEHASTKVTSWSLDFKSLFSISLIRLLDLLMIALTYRAQYDDDFLYHLWHMIHYYDTFVKLWSHAEFLTYKSIVDYKLIDLDNMDDCYKLPVSSRSHPVSFLVTRGESHSIILFLKSQKMDIFCRSLVISYIHKALNVSEITLQLKSLLHLVIRETKVTNFELPTRFSETIKHLVLEDCHLTEVPQAVGSLIRLTVLNISKNKDIRTLPVSLGNLRELRTFLYKDCSIEFPPKNVLKRSAQDVIKYLQAFQRDDESVPHNEAKLIVAGQEGVGKSTLIRAMQRKKWFSDIKHPEKTTDGVDINHEKKPDGVDITPEKKTDGVEIKTLQLNGTTFLVYDLAGDVEYHNTHPLFLSSQCLHLVVFDLSQILVGKGTRSVDQLCRLELWLKMIAAQHPKTFVIIVGTHADDSRITTEILSAVRKQVSELLEKYRTHHKEYFDKCILCNVKLMPEELHEIQATKSLEGVEASGSCIPHILGYFEVSSLTKYPPAKLSLTNKNLKSLKASIASCNLLLTNTVCRIPKTWLSFYENLSQREMKPTAAISEIFVLAEESNVPSDMVESMLRFFHSQGNFLWYEDIPEMKELIITEPHWLSKQLRTLISYRPSVNAVCDGILHTSSLSVVWPNMTDENRQNLLALFRSVGLCFSISVDKELFPYNLPIGWPDDRKWRSLPKEGQSQTSLLFTFTFLPPTFFSKLIVEVNKMRASFPDNAEPLYFRFHIYYDTKKRSRCKIHCPESREDAEYNFTHHKVHYEIMPHKNTMKVSIRGPTPCCIVPDVCTTVKDVQTNYYPGVTLQTHLICPLCEMNKVNDPQIFPLASPKHKRLFCLKSREYVESIDDILCGKYQIPMPKNPIEIILDTLEDYHSPKLFVVLPINIDCLSLKDRFVYSHLKDGYAVHLLCECPDQWHFLDSPGFRIDKPKEFLEKYGKHLCTAMKGIGTLGTPLRIAAAAEPHCKIGAAVASGATSVGKELEGFLENVFDKYQQLMPQPDQNLAELQKSSGCKRSQLAQFLETSANLKNGKFAGQLVPKYVDRCGEVLWLCEEHYQQFTIVRN